MLKIKGILLGIGIFLIATDGYCQFEAGILAGLSSANFSGDKPKNGRYYPSTGVMAGLSFDWWIAEHVALSVQPGLYWQGSSVQFKDSVDGEYKDSLKVRLTTANLPLFIKIEEP